MPLRLLGNRVHLAPLPKADKTASGLALPPQYQDDRLQYRVLAVGTGRNIKNGWRLITDFRVGQCVLFNPDLGVDATLPDGTIIADADRVEMVWKDGQ